MGGPTRPRPDELARRILAYGDTWRAVAACTAPADRPRAEAALRGLYALEGLPEPRIAWASSPWAGMLSFDLASRVHAPLVSRYARGDVGNGENRTWNGTAAPLGMDPVWVSRLLENVRERLGVAALDHAALAGHLGFGGTLRVMPLLRTFASDRPQLPRPDPAGIARAASTSVLGAMWPSLTSVLGEAFAAELVAVALEQVAASIGAATHGRSQAVQSMQPGQWDATTPVMAAARDVLGGFIWRHSGGRAEHEAAVDLRLELARAAGPWWAMDGLAIIAERPLLLAVDDRGRPHAPAGPAMAWADGTELWAWHGVRVRPEVVTDPGSITVAMVDGERNAEVRRVLVERMGVERLVREGAAQLVAEDETGRLWRRELGSRWSGEEPVVTVEVRNSTPEPDGSHRTYFLRVPPATRTPREGVAWTFGLGSVEYRPAVET